MPKRDYKQFCPTARALNVVGERWTLLIVRDLLLSPRRYSDLRRSLPGMASNLLAVRLGELEEGGLVTKERVDHPSPRDVYTLTDRGRALEPLLLELARFGIPLLDTPTAEQPMVADRVPLGLRAMMHEPELPDDGLTIHFDLDEGNYLITVAPQGRPGGRLLPVERITMAPVADGESPPADVTVRGTMAGILWVRQGLIDMETAARDEMIVVSGSEEAQQTLRFVYRLEPVAA